MFTGIVEEVGIVKEIKTMEGGKEFSIEASFTGECHVDESIAVNGVCLTVVSFDEKSFHVQAVSETLRKTNLGNLELNGEVNLERSLTLDKAIEGHIMQGHVDTTGTLKKIEKEGADILITVEYPEEYRDLIVGRGSIAIDGISLTVARESGNKCVVAIIPYTWDYTNLKSKELGDPLNIEFDIFGKYIVKYLENHQAN
ncbi:MAG: riboflavin synthase [Balneolaceae bacterium]|nr:riboflavin synthase [Balneolaceae bacterium]